MQLEPEVQIITRYVSYLPADHAKHKDYALSVEYVHKYSGYTIRNHFMMYQVLGSDGNWKATKDMTQEDIEGTGSEKYFFTLDEAIDIAKKYAPYVVRNFSTAFDVLHWETVPYDLRQDSEFQQHFVTEAHARIKTMTKIV